MHKSTKLLLISLAVLAAAVYSYIIAREVYLAMALLVIAIFTFPPEIFREKRHSRRRRRSHR